MPETVLGLASDSGGGSTLHLRELELQMYRGRDDWADIMKRMHTDSWGGFAGHISAMRSLRDISFTFRLPHYVSDFIKAYPFIVETLTTTKARIRFFAKELHPGETVYFPISSSGVALGVGVEKYSRSITATNYLC